MRPSRAEALAFYGQFRASNAALAARHFPQAGALFAEDFGGYPEAADGRSLTVEGAAEVAARLQETWLQEIRRLEAELAIRDARIDWDRGQTDRAVRTLHEASLRYQNHPPPFRYLGELLLRTRDFAGAAEAAGRAVALNANSGEYTHFHGVTLAHAGDLAGAELAQRRALARDPANAGARTALQALVAAMASGTRPPGSASG